MAKEKSNPRTDKIMELLKASDPETQRLALALAIGLKVVDKLDDIKKAVYLLKEVFPVGGK